MMCKIVFSLNIPEFVMLNCDAAVVTLTCTLSTNVQYNPINKHPYTSLGCENKQKTFRDIFAKTIHLLVHMQYHLH